jgi:hypothetical protein
MATQFPGPLGVGAQKPSTAAANQRHRRSHRMLGSADDAGIESRMMGSADDAGIESRMLGSADDAGAIQKAQPISRP